MSATCRAQSLGQRGDQVASRAAVVDRPLASRQPHRRGQRPRAGDLHLEPPPVAVGGLGQRVEVGVPERLRAMQITARRVGQPPPGGLQVDGQVDQERGPTTDHVGARPTVGQLHQVRERLRLAGAGSSPRTVRCASNGSVPGQEPIPVARLTRHAATP